MRFSFDKLKSMQSEIARQFRTGEIKFEDLKKIAGFDVTYDGDKAICAGVILDAKTLEVIEKKIIIAKVPMNYVPGFLAFREGPLILQAYYDFESDPDLLIISGNGIAHPRRCGLATYIGVELAKPAIGIAKSITGDLELKEGKVVLNGEIVGAELQTRDHARPIIVSPGNMISLDSATEIIRKLIKFPHKMPEPLHIAHKIASKKLKEIREKEKDKE
ncbi:hypothetical protein DRJ25_01975 [Candidatus Woesearchaeota archaeon]|nr:MAG: hypothetical protein DRJ25_01975 [Candidatus Woesearchaeota archaeon]